MNAELTVSQAPPDTTPAAVIRTKSSSAIWAVLIWKEWCEHRWKILAMSVVGLSILLPIWWTMKLFEGSGTALAYLMMAAPLSALFLGMGIAAGEQATGTIDFARRLPTESWRLALVKLVMAIVAILVPLSFALLVAPEHLFGLMPVLILVGTSLVLWFAVLGMNRPDEISAAAFGVAGAVLVWALFAIGCYQYKAACERHPDALIVSEGDGVLLDEWRHDFQTVASVIAGALPGGILIKAPDGPSDRISWLWFLAAYATTHVPLAWRWLTRYGTSPPRSSAQTRATTDTRAWLAAPLSSPTAAILWKQLRETLPVALAALALAVAWSLAVVLSNTLGDGSTREQIAKGAVFFMAFTGVCSFLASVVAGVGLFLEDLRPGVHTFWRSRPIPPGRWFWLKYAAGLACLASVFGGVMAIAAVVAWSAGERYHELSDLAGYAQGVLGFWVVYSGAACATCLVRQPIYAAILGVGFPCILYGLTATVLVKLGLSDATSVTTLLIVVGLAGIAATLLAWQAVRRDWAILR